MRAFSCQGMALILLALVGSTLSPAQGTFTHWAPSASDWNRTESHLHRPKRHLIHPHALLTVPELIRARGYPSEIHRVTSSDGYILEMHRIPCGRAQYQASLSQGSYGARCKNNRVIFLQHCVLCSSADFVMNDPDQALAFILADLGYDVWLGNARGNLYGRRHLHLSPDEHRFWKFSWDEIAIYDMPAMLTYVREHTGVPKMDYLGHSMGSTVFFAMMNYYPYMNSWIRVMVGLAPVAYMHHKHAPIGILAPVVQEVTDFLEKAGAYEVGRQTLSKSKFSAIFCSPLSIFNFLCTLLHFLSGGPNENYVDKEYLPVISAHTPAGASLRTAAHFIQLTAARKFQAYDHGPQENLRRYGTVTPRVYSLGAVKVPVGLFFSDGDWISDSRDVLEAAWELPTLAVYYKVPLRDFNHMDFLWAENARPLVYEEVLKYLGHYS